MLPLAPRIMSYLDANASQWVPYQLIYTLASSKGYSHKEITSALTIIEHTIPYAVWSVSAGDYRAEQEAGITGAGKYYRKHHLTPTQHAMYKRSVEAFASLP